MGPHQELSWEQFERLPFNVCSIGYRLNSLKRGTWGYTGDYVGEYHGGLTKGDTRSLDYVGPCRAEVPFLHRRHRLHNWAIPRCVLAVETEQPYLWLARNDGMDPYSSPYLTLIYRGPHEASKTLNYW